MQSRPRTVLSDRQWWRIAPHIRGRPQDPGVTGRNNRRFVEGVLWILRTGAPWRDLPRYFGRWSTVYQRFRRWCRGQVWQALWRALRPKSRSSLALLDSTIVRAHQHSAGGRGGMQRCGIGRSRGGRTTKLHVIVTPSWQLLAHAVTGGQVADIRLAPRLVRGLPRRVRTVVGDRAYDSDRLVALLAQRGVAVSIPPRRHRRVARTWPRHVYGERHGVERYFARLKQLRRLATRYDKQLGTWQGFFFAANVLLVCGGHGR